MQTVINVLDALKIINMIQLLKYVECAIVQQANTSTNPHINAINAQLVATIIQQQLDVRVVQLMHFTM